jgi:glycyl-tRNA synthetase beta chain
MPVSVALDADGKPTPALGKKMEAKGIGRTRRSPASSASHGRQGRGAVPHRHGGRGEARRRAGGIVQDALKALPIPKVMRWGDGDATFVRPVHKLTLLHGADVVPGRVLDLESGRTTRGHRFMSAARSTSPPPTPTSRRCSPKARSSPTSPSAASQHRAPAARRGRAAGRTCLGEYADCSTKSPRWSSTRRCTWRVRGRVPRRAAGMPDPHHAANQKYFPLFDGAMASCSTAS